jgi:putative transposase
MKKKLTYARTCVYNCNYHLVFCTKYRKKVLTEEVEFVLKKLFQEIAQEKGFQVQKSEVGEADHLHLFLSAPPKLSPSYLVKMLKGISARKLFLQFPQLKGILYKGHLWNSSYYLETIGSTSETAILHYIENQKGSNDPD